MTAFNRPTNENSPKSPLGRFESDMEMEKIYNDEEMNLSDIADRLLDELEDDYEEEKEQSPAIRKLLYVVLVCSIVGGFSALAYYAYQFGRKPVDISQLQLVEASNEAYKEKPADPGGMEVPNMDKTVYDSISGKENGGLPKVERILPPPEEPMNPHQVVYESVNGSASGDKKQLKVTNSREALLANKGLAEKELKPVVVKDNQWKTPKKVNIASGLKPISEEDLKAVPTTKPVNIPSKAVNARYRVQLGAFRSEGDASREWTRLSRRFSDELNALQHFVIRKDLGEKGIFYRLQAGPFDDSADARLACKKLVENKQGCFFVEVK